MKNLKAVEKQTPVMGLAAKYHTDRDLFERIFTRMYRPAAVRRGGPTGNGTSRLRHFNADGPGSFRWRATAVLRHLPEIKPIAAKVFIYDR